MKRREFMLISCLFPAFLYSLNGSAAQSSSIVRPEDYGAVGDGQHDDTLAVQRAIDSGAGTVILDKKYLVSPRQKKGVPGVVGDNSVCIDIRSHLKLVGNGSLVLDKNSQAANGSMLCNLSETEISDFHLSIILDGSNSGRKKSFSGVTLINANRCNITKGCVIKNFTYNGIRFARRSLSCLIDGVSVSNVGYIGIQAQQPRNIILRNNIIRGTEDNGIDLESNNGYQDAHIYNNLIVGCNVGVFLESGGNAIIFNNDIMDFRVSGVFMNRINTSANNVKISNNKFRGLMQGTTKGAIAINNNIKNISISNNEFDSVEHVVWMNGNISQIHIGKNKIKNIGSSFLWVPDKKNDLTNTTIDNENSFLLDGGKVRIFPEGINIKDYAGVKVI